MGRSSGLGPALGRSGGSPGSSSLKVVLFFPESCKEAGDRFRNVLDLMIPGDRMLFLQNFQDLSRILCRLENKPKVAVLAAGNWQELEGLWSLRPFLHNTHLVLVLPDGKVETLSRAHRLRPRFLTYLTDNFTELVPVLRKMLNANWL